TAPEGAATRRQSERAPRVPRPQLVDLAAGAGDGDTDARPAHGVDGRGVMAMDYTSGADSATAAPTAATVVAPASCGAASAAGAAWPRRPAPPRTASGR